MIIDFCKVLPQNQIKVRAGCFPNTLYYRFINILVLIVTESGSIANAGGIGHQVGNGALLHHAGEEMTLRTSGEDSHIIASMNANSAVDVAVMKSRRKQIGSLITYQGAQK